MKVAVIGAGTARLARGTQRHSRWFSKNQFGLLIFYDSDHGTERQTPLEWIESMLHENGIHDATGEIFLHTLPRVLGYVFNPVSFWFREHADGTLRAVVCEVNNTFGERHAGALHLPLHVCIAAALARAHRLRRRRGSAAADQHRGECTAARCPQRARVFFGYPTMTFSVVAKIHWQALKLFFKRVPFQSKPTTR